ncbi:MAG: hypothetical protein DMG27_12220, partial [Acidobacteria bacterium]
FESLPLDATYQVFCPAASEALRSALATAPRTIQALNNPTYLLSEFTARLARRGRGGALGRAERGEVKSGILFLRRLFTAGLSPPPFSAQVGAVFAATCQLA